MTNSPESNKQPVQAVTDERDLRKILGPSRFSAEGFLGADPRRPEDIMSDDAAMLAGLGVDKARLVDTLRSAYDAAEQALGAPVTVSAGCVAVHCGARGKIPSPFVNEGTFAKGETVFTLAASGASFSLTPLSLHLIDKHGFFQGRGSPYRVEPDVAARMMGLIK
jgi:hypothetical protein